MERKAPIKLADSSLGDPPVLQVRRVESPPEAERGGPSLSPGARLSGSISGIHRESASCLLSPVLRLPSSVSCLAQLHTALHLSSALYKSPLFMQNKLADAPKAGQFFQPCGPLLCKTNPIPKTKKSPQTLYSQRLTPILPSAPPEKTNPIKPKSNPNKLVDAPVAGQSPCPKGLSCQGHLRIYRMKHIFYCFRPP